MKKIGLIGEDPNDTSSIEILLNKKYDNNLKFFTLSKTLKGDQLESKKGKNLVVTNFEQKKCDFAICIRDLDSLESDKSQLTIRIDWFNSIKTSLNGKGILLLNIWQLEGLIFADIEIFNKLYGTNLKSNKNPEFVENPKKELKRLTEKMKKKFHENDCPTIFKELRFDYIIKNSKSFKNFIAELEKQLAA
jgi:hypothetical protein